VPVALGTEQVNAAPGVHRRIAPLVVELAHRWEQITGDLLVAGWCWGYAPRRIRGGSAWSNHAWGLAVDLNAPRWPLHSTRRPPNADQMRSAADDLGFRWGAYYSGRRDPMHFEFMGTPGDADRIASTIRTAPFDLEDTMFCAYGDTDSDAVRALQIRLRYVGADVIKVLTSGGDADGVDGHYGDLTARALATALDRPDPVRRYGPWQHEWLRAEVTRQLLRRATFIQPDAAADGVPEHTHRAEVLLE